MNSANTGLEKDNRPAVNGLGTPFYDSILRLCALPSHLAFSSEQRLAASQRDRPTPTGHFLPTTQAPKELQHPNPSELLDRDSGQHEAPRGVNLSGRTGFQARSGNRVAYGPDSPVCNQGVQTIKASRLHPHR